MPRQNRPLIGTLKAPATIIEGGEQVGDNCPPSEERHGPRQAGSAGPNSVGGDEGEASGFDFGGDGPLKVGAIAEQFRHNTRTRFKQGSGTWDQYLRYFRRFANHAGLEALTKKQLQTKRGKRLILDFMDTVPLKSRRTLLHGLEAVWTKGIGLPWPVDVRDDFGQGTLPQVGYRETPRDQEVRPFLEAAENEADPYIKLVVFLVLNYGWRPENQLAHARWRWVTDRYGPPAFVTKDGVVEGFKSNSRVVAYIPPMVAEALQLWKNYCPRTDPEAYILPRRRKRKLDPNSPQTRQGILELWEAFEGRSDLKHIPPVYFRHWVKHACGRLSDPALAALEGHKPPRDGSMRNAYDTPGIQALLEEQRAKFPHGAVGTLRPPLVVVEGLEAEMALVREAKEGRLSPTELALKLSDLWLKSRQVIQP